jgi:hypothetical protein
MGYRINGVFFDEVPEQSYRDWDAKDQPREPGHAVVNGRALKTPQGAKGGLCREVDPANIDDAMRQLAEDIAEACAEDLGLGRAPAIRWYDDVTMMSPSSLKAAPYHTRGSNSFAESEGTRGFHNPAEGDGNAIWLHRSLEGSVTQLISTCAHEMWHVKVTAKHGTKQLKSASEEQREADEYAEAVLAQWDDLELPAPIVANVGGIFIGPSIKTNSF